MHEFILLMVSAIFLIAVLYLLDFRKAEPYNDSNISELHARNRYLMAEKIKNEIDQQH